MAKLILLTGGTGNIGFQILIQALRAGYHVRCATRSESKAETIRSHRLLKELRLGSEALNFVTVSDITMDNAYDEAIEGCHFAIHVATVVPTNVVGADPAKGDEIFVNPAVKSTLSILKAAEREKSIERIVITSSAVAVVPFEVWYGLRPGNGKTYKPTDRNQMSREAPFDTLVQAYMAGKTAALLETESWVADRRPDFDVVNVHPGFVIGRNELASTVEEVNTGTNTIALNAILGKKIENIPGKIRAGCCCHVEDVAEVHVRALAATLDGLKSGQCKSFAIGLPVKWDDGLKITEKRFPNAVRAGTLPLGGHQSECEVDIDCSETEQLLGRKLRGFEEQTVSVVGHYLELAK